MSSSEYDRIIAQEQHALASIKEQGEKLIPEFKRVTTSYVRELSIKLMKSYFKSKLEVARSLSAEKLEEIKQEFTGILDSLPEQTSERLDDSEIWLHRVEIPEGAVSDMTFSYQFEKRSNKSMDDAIRELIGLVGSMLMNYGFVEVGKDFTWKTTTGGITLYANDLPSRGMNHHRALTKLMDQYKDLLVEYVFSFQNLRKAEQAKRSAQLD
jgi:hypothetical protein